ncbi:MAG: hypothetical protein K2Y01_06230 [Rhabdochlamydiaceae bacterium]|nr:hypothetical protein [Rhabdochlamydiaceae bacterium]
MHITVEISLYPLTENYAPLIRDFIARLKKHPELKVVSNATSTQIVGEHFKVFEVLSKETAETFSSDKSVFVMKMLSFERDIEKCTK